MSKKKESKPLFKKWWFWLIVVFVIGGIGNIIDPSSNEETVKQSQTTAKKKTDKKTEKSKKKATKKSPSKKESDQTGNSVAATEKEGPTQSKLTSFAKSFGLKDAETVQKRVNTAYSSQYIDGYGQGFGWKTKYGTLIRIDDDNNMTTVYLYDENSTDGLGTKLYEGHTIFQKARVNNYY